MSQSDYPDASPSPEVLAAHLEGQIQMRIDELAASLPRTMRTGDTAKFLAGVRTATTDTIRQAPAAAQRALAATQTLDTSLSVLIRIIEDDPSLSQAVLRYANSAYYATVAGGTTVSLLQATHRIGASGLHNVVISHMINGTLCRPGGIYQTLASAVHTHMIRTASLARMLAPTFGQAPDNGYALGLLHDVGKLVMFDAIGATRHRIRRDLVVPKEVVHGTLMLAHEAYGGLAALRWGLGVQVATAIATHHRTPAPSLRNRMSELLFVAERADHAKAGRRAFDTPIWWTEGALTTDRPNEAESVRELIETHDPLAMDTAFA